MLEECGAQRLLQYTANVQGIRSPFLLPTKHPGPEKMLVLCRPCWRLNELARKKALDSDKCPATTVYLMEKCLHKLKDDVLRLTRTNHNFINYAHKGRTGQTTFFRKIKKVIFFANARFLIQFLEEQIGERSFQSCREHLGKELHPDVAGEVLEYLGVNDLVQ